ncbi:MAG: chitobiase/beta-hexosaminidase C-terminal domain-containing protein [Bacilli bacterium]|nr:chitobiase/beta-hexosaminidase C-terminal domain-containing protein [Bacilli bacterium]
MKKIIISTLFIILTFIITTILVSYFILNNGTFLTKFNFKKVSNIGLNYYVYFEKVQAASNYDVIVYNSANEIIYKENTKNNSTTIIFDSLNHNEVYKIIVIAYDKEGNKRSVEEPYTFLWNELAFSDTNYILMDNNNDYIVSFIGDYKKKDYKLSIKEEETLIDEVDINSDEYIIENKYFKDKKKNYTLEITDNNLVISKLNIYNLMSPITDITFTKPASGDMLDYNDIAVTFTGGDNASNYLFELYSENKLIRRKEIDKKSFILSSNLFKKSAQYTVKITASYLDYIDYSKTSEISFTINPKETLKPVYTDYNQNYIKEGTKISLLSPDKDVKIYYTLDGTEPTKDSILYEDKIEINNNTIIKAIAIQDKKNDSIVSTFDFKIGRKSEYKVYLSASNQYNNLGVGEVGYTNEKKEMNDLTNYIEKRLESYGVKTYRNEFGDINRWTADSTYLGVDLHLAIHSNASEDHEAYGIETWIENGEAKTYSLAQKIQNNLMNVYYNKEDELANRGVKYANGTLAEVNPNYTPCGILLEIGHHDYLNDAKWIMENKESIGNSVADSILEYFQIK